jgi:hypothetical protein
MTSLTFLFEFSVLALLSAAVAVCLAQTAFPAIGAWIQVSTLKAAPVPVSVRDTRNPIARNVLSAAEYQLGNCGAPALRPTTRQTPSLSRLEFDDGRPTV